MDDDVQTSLLLFFFFVKVSWPNLLNVIDRLRYVGWRNSCRRTCKLDVSVYFGMVVGSGGVDFSRIVILFSNDVIIVCMPLINFSNSLKQQEGQRKDFPESLMDSNTIFGSPAHFVWIQESHAPSQKIKSTPELPSDGVGISSKQIMHENTHLP